MMLSYVTPGNGQPSIRQQTAASSVTQDAEFPLTIDHLVRLRSKQTHGQPMISYPSSGILYVDYTLRQLDALAYNIAKRLSGSIPAKSSSKIKPLVIGLLGPSNLSYLVTLLAISKLGHTVLFLSTRISNEAYASLLTKTESTYLVAHQNFTVMTREMKNRIPSLQVVEMPNVEPSDHTLADFIDTRITLNLDPVQETKEVAWIIHSSGSTGLPKPIYQTHSAAIMNYATNMNMRGFITLPIFHLNGLSNMFRAIYSKKQIHMYNAELPLTQQYLTKTLLSHDFEIFYGVPYALKVLAETKEGIEFLRKFKVVMFAGSACPDALGDMLVRNDVNLVSHYGTYVLTFI